MDLIQLLNEQTVLINSKFHSRSLSRLTSEIAQIIIDRTPFLCSSANFRSRVFAIQINLTHQPLCQTCQSPIFPTLRNSKIVVPQYCSRKCINNLTSRDKRKITTKERYGVEHPLQSRELREKQQNTIKEKYGVDSVAYIPNVKEKKEQTNLKRYGAKNPQQNKEVQTKTKETNLKRYGTTCSLLGEDAQSKTKQTNLERYGTEFPMQNPNVQAHTKQTLKDMYGVEFYNQYHIPSETLAMLNDKEFLEHQHCVLEKRQTQIAEMLNVPQALVSRYFTKHDIKTKHFYQSIGEKEVAEFVEALGLMIECNIRDVIPPLELDIYVPDLKLALEYNGTYWHSEERGRGESYHNRKTVECLAHGIVLLHIDEELWKSSQDLVKTIIISTVEQLKEHPL